MKRVINLCFHGVGEPSRELEHGEASYWISDDLFVGVLDLIADRPDVRLSFDDGNASDLAAVLPALCERNLRATFFPVAERIGQFGSVDQAGLRQLVSNGMSIGSHGMRHRPWRGMSNSDLEAELVEARRVIAAASGVAVMSAACPLGRYDRRVLNRARRLGYQRVYTSDRARARGDAWLQPRYTVRRSDDIRSVREILAPAPRRREQVFNSARIAVKRWR